MCESHVRWGTFLPNLGTLGLWVLELFAMYATDGQTNGRTKATLIAPFPTVGGTITVVGHVRELLLTNVTNASTTSDQLPTSQQRHDIVYCNMRLSYHNIIVSEARNT